MSVTKDKPTRRRSLTRTTFFLVVFAVGASLIYAASSRTASISLPKRVDPGTATVDRQPIVPAGMDTAYVSHYPAVASLLQSGGETIATYASDCVTPKTEFVLGEVVCAKASGVDLQTFARSATWSNPGRIVVSRNELLSDTDNFMIPTAGSYAIDNITGDNRGTWQVKLVPFGRSVVRASAFFKVSDPQSAAADLSVYNSVTDPLGDVPDGVDVTVTLTATNNGPDAVPDVQLAELVPSNSTFVSAAQDSGPTFNCTHPTPGGTGSSLCTISSLASGAQASFTFVYHITSGVPKGTLIASTAAIGQITTPSAVVTELNSSNNQWTARTATSVNTNTPSGCVLACPANILVTANTTQNDVFGAVVTFDAAEPGGDCGTITALPASGSFFPVGTTTVNSSASLGGGGCSFTVTVVEVAAPTIACADDQTASATGNDLEVSVTVNAPSTTGNGVRLDATRSDGLSRTVTDPYSIGTTIITWIATETFAGIDPETNEPITVDGRAVSCTQEIIVTSSGAPTISCPSNETFNATSGCSYPATAAEIGTPTTTGSNVVLTSRRSDDLELTAPFPAGTTTITWTATDDIDRVASCTQVITVTTTGGGGGDNIPPTLNVPADVSTTTGSCNALLDDELGVATADDDCSGSVNITRTGIPTVACPSNPNGCPTFVFPTGTTVITYTATDAAGNTTVGTQNVTVTESPAVPPTIAAPAAVTIYTGAGATSCGVTVADLDATLGTATASDNCALDTVTRSGVPAGNTFPVGTTTITYTATDRSGNTATDTQDVTVIDNTEPVVTPPANVTAYTGPGATSCGTVVDDATLGAATATDNCPGIGAIQRTGVPAGNNFPVGTTTITYSVTDANGNSDSATQTVTVIDNTVPVITPPANVTAYTGAGATSCGTVVDDAAIGTPSATDNCPDVGAISRNGVPAGNVFPVGTTVIEYSVTDAHGNGGTAQQTVTVIDNTPPVISCPASITLEPTCPSGAIATWTPPVGTDNCPNPNTVQTAGGAPGSVFPIGTTTVAYTVTDGANNTASCSFTVTVKTVVQTIDDLKAAVNANQQLNPPQRNGLLSKLDSAQEHIQKGNQNGACAKLTDFINSTQNFINNGALSAAVGNAWISTATNLRNAIGCTNNPCS
jgi:hypothetical protein